ncbi:MAG: hypothetical protein WCT46_04060 [Candidatus Gracilibacteria bacterium]|jgi:hypothetical protein
MTVETQRNHTPVLLTLTLAVAAACSDPTMPPNEDVCTDSGGAEVECVSDQLAAATEPNCGPAEDGTVTDDDQDGTADYQDAGCHDPVTGVYDENRSEGTDCNDGIDNNGDGLIDADDLGCQVEGVYINTARFEGESCFDGIDNDGDGSIDAADDGCASGGDNSEWGTCGDTLDNNGNTWIDWSDPVCLDVSTGNYNANLDEVVPAVEEEDDTAASKTDTGLGQ